MELIISSLSFMIWRQNCNLTFIQGIVILLPGLSFIVTYTAQLGPPQGNIKCLRVLSSPSLVNQQMTSQIINIKNLNAMIT
jgi:hypothetical protein